MANILVLGTVGRERIHSCGRVSSVVFGGTGFYATEAIIKVKGAEPLLISPLGYDLSPEELLGQFSRDICVDGLNQRLGLPSFFWEGRYNDDFSESDTLALENRLVDDFEPEWSVLESELPEIKSCYLAAYEPRLQFACRNRLPSTFSVSETLEYWIGRDRDGVLAVARASNGFVLTEREFRALWGFDLAPYSPYSLVNDIVVELELDFLIVTFAERGSQVFDSEGTFFAPAITCETVDPTGAGNAFSGGIVAHLFREDRCDRPRLLDAVALGTALASLQVLGYSNYALRRATDNEVLFLWEEARKRISWYGDRSPNSGGYWGEQP